MTSLAFLSLSRVGHHRKVPHVPSNTERLQAFRRYQPVQFANTTFNGGGELQNCSRNRSDERGESVPPASTLRGTQPAIALPSRPHSPAAAGWVPSSSEVTK